MRNEVDPHAALREQAEAGRRRLAGHADAERQRQAAADAPSPERFRWRVRDPRTDSRAGMAVALTLMALPTAYTFLFPASTHRGVVAQGNMAVWGGLLIGLLLLVLAGVRDAARTARTAAAVRAWHAALPFPFPTFIDRLSSPHPLTAGRLVATFAPGTPPAAQELVQGMIGLTGHPATRVTVAADALILDHGPGDPELGRWVRDLVERVLLPVHAAHPLARVELRVNADATP